MMWFIEDKNLVGFDIFFLKFVFLCIYMYFKVKDVYIYILIEREREVVKERESFIGKEW